jgi:dipeptidyl aminopeptidase/acylaminoacyl peptidase
MNREQHLDALLSMPGLLIPQASPDGKWVAWMWRGVGAAADVFAVRTDGAEPPVRLTETADETRIASWTSDSAALLVTQDHGGNERASLYRIDLDRPLEMVRLTEDNPGYFIRGGQLHPDGRWLIYAANYDFAAGREIEATWLYRHDLQTGERAVLVRPEKPSYYVPQLNHQGTHILYTRKDLHPSGIQVWMVDVDGNQDREVLNFGPDVKVMASWHPDGQRVLVLAEKGTHRRLGIWDRTTGDTRWLLDDPARNIESAFVPHGSDSAVVIEVKSARRRASLLDLQTGGESPLPEVPGNLVPLAPVGDGNWVGVYYSANQPTDIVRFRPGDADPGSFTSLTRVWERTSITANDLAPAEDFRWTSVDGREVQGWLYRPQGEARGTIVYVHGGPTSHSENKLSTEIQFYVSQGFNVLDPNYRGSTGFGLEFQNAIKEDGWGGREQDDIRTGIEALIREGIAEPGKVGITGTSYGGYSSWCAITRWPTGTLAASAPICGMTDLVVDYNTTRPDLRPYSEEMIGGSPDQVPDKYRERSPINFVDNIKGKLLIVQGLQDPNVSPENVSAVSAALDKGGVDYDVLAFEDEGHGILKPRNQRTLYLRLVDFFEKAFSAQT